MLDAHVLVLNKSWIAINVASARRALALLYQGHARVVHPADYSLYEFDAWCVHSRWSGTVAIQRLPSRSAYSIASRLVISLSSTRG